MSQFEGCLWAGGVLPGWLLPSGIRCGHSSWWFMPSLGGELREIPFVGGKATTSVWTWPQDTTEDDLEDISTEGGYGDSFGESGRT